MQNQKITAELTAADDRKKCRYAQESAQVAEVLSQEDMPNPELLSLLLNCLYGLSKLDEPLDKVKATFEFRAACLSGYEPDLSGCQACGNGYAQRFDVSAGCLECPDHRDPASGGLRLPVTPGALDAMRYLEMCEPKRIFGFAAG